jgi:polysaccharide deacetylase 2 family uncharacterized protein YibQ
MTRTSKGRPGSGRSVWAGYFFSFLLGVLFAVGGYLVLTHRKVLPPVPPSPERSTPERPAPQKFPDVAVKKKEARSSREVAGQPRKVAIVIDDLGGDKDLFRDLLDLNVPVTFSILPFTPFARNVAQQAFGRGREVILHLPMEPRGYPRVNPGEGALLYGMNRGELLRQLARDIEAVPHARGVSNHMGSRLMEDPDKMKIILADLKKRGLFFLDSRTTPQTVGFRVARSLGMKAAEKTLFLDHSQEENHVREKMDELGAIALSRGRAIGIGHPHPSTILALKEMLPELQARGIEIVPLSALADE